ncbi:MAG: YiiX/YebB-like N1pC/P60 family cysteine hydrolase [Aquabacterium sp.]
MLRWSSRTDGKEPILAESVVPMSRRTRLSKVIARSDYWRVAVKRPLEPLTARQQLKLHEAVRKRMGVLYDGGFNLRSNRQFCSKFVREVMYEATGLRLGEIETMRDLFQNNPEARVPFWKLWFLGRIPWERQTVTPVSVMLTPCLHTVFDGQVLMPHRSGMRARRLDSSGWSGISSLPAG